MYPFSEPSAVPGMPPSITDMDDDAFLADLDVFTDQILTPEEIQGIQSQVQQQAQQVEQQVEQQVGQQLQQQAQQQSSSIPDLIANAGDVLQTVAHVGELGSDLAHDTADEAQYISEAFLLDDEVEVTHANDATQVSESSTTEDDSSDSLGEVFSDVLSEGVTMAGEMLDGTVDVVVGVGKTIGSVASTIGDIFS